LKQERETFDRALIEWSEKLDSNWLIGELKYFSISVGSDIKMQKWVLVTHMFNHQTHHRGQVHCMLTQSGATPGDTDLLLMR